MSQAAQVRAEWLSRLLSTAPVERPKAEAAVREVYLACDLPPPRFFLWFDSPYAGLWAMGLLSAGHDALWQQIVQAMSRYQRERELIERLQAAMCRSADQPDWKSLVSAAGKPMALVMQQAGRAGQPHTIIQTSILLARIGLYDNVNDSVAKLDERDDLSRAEHYLRGTLSGQNGWSTINTLMSGAIGCHYSFATMALDEVAFAGRTVPRLLPSAWTAARVAGPWWWPLTHSVVLSDRPVEMHLNEKLLLHRGGGPAMVYRDGIRIWAWNGRAMREEWIMQPESIAARDLKGFDPSFRDYAASRTKTAGPVAKLTPSPILKQALPADPQERAAILRRYNRGALPILDRYIAGEHEKAWEELIALGPSVRADPYAADALAVAYETMRRVNLNVGEVTARLRAIGYRFAYEAGVHDPPGRSVHRQIARLEKKVGALPFALRAFYEVVGMVNWMGEHASLAPRGGSVAPDPLVVYPLEGALADAEESFEDGEGFIVIAPDDLQKSNTSGGEPYGIAIPDACADAELLNERHELHFVAYLRLVFRWGGFPGYEGVDIDVPPEIATLSDALVRF
ncbi:MAG TPA: hypothetical protein VKT27_04945 [Candidatus Binataceae bacterium]|nr:hypothetical protein [Candidatus Binataceae bacterium]